MELERYRISRWDAASAATATGLPLAIVPVDRIDPAAPPAPFPLLAIGPVSHPSSCLADIVAGDEASLMAVVRPVVRSPQAAAVTVQLLRLVELLPVAAAQVAESLAYGVLQGGEEHARWLAARARGEAPEAGQVLLQRENGLLAITLDRTSARNAIDRPMRDSLREAFELAALDDTIVRVELRGSGKAFCVGAELGEFGTTRDPAAAHSIRMATLPAHALARCADKCHVHVQGACVGAGLELAAYAGRITAGTDAWFQLPELAMGLLPGAGGSVSVTRRIGRHRAGWMMLSGKRVNARTALEWGLVDALVDA